MQNVHDTGCLLLGCWLASEARVGARAGRSVRGCPPEGSVWLSMECVRTGHRSEGVAHEGPPLLETALPVRARGVGRPWPGTLVVNIFIGRAVYLPAAVTLA